MDTATKRYSAINVGSPWRGVLPLPDGSIDAGDRQIVPFLYNGILAGEAEEQPEVVVQPQQPQSQPAGGVYAPLRKRKPRRIVFLEQELLDQHERLKGLEQQRVAQERRAHSQNEDRAATADQALARTIEQTETIRVAIAQLEAEIAHEMALRDDEDAMSVILRTLH